MQSATSHLWLRTDDHPYMHTEPKKKQLSLTTVNNDVWAQTDCCVHHQPGIALYRLRSRCSSGCRKPQILASGICSVASLNVAFLSLQFIIMVVLGLERSPTIPVGTYIINLRSDDNQIFCHIDICDLIVLHMTCMDRPPSTNFRESLKIELPYYKTISVSWCIGLW